ncbi:MAG: hypothetical protein ACI8TQ_003874 [Planctomycetota bacterium]|jgi:hypothetical protein
MMRSLTILCALSLAVGVFASSKTSTTPPVEVRPTPGHQAQNCKPDAPIQIELAPSDLIGGRARLDYTVTPVIDAIAIEVSIGFPEGGNLRWHNAPLRAAAKRGEVRNGSMSVDLPVNLPGVEVQVQAHITIPDADAPDGIATYTTTRAAVWGEVDRVVEGVSDMIVDGQLTLNTAATRN